MRIAWIETHLGKKQRRNDLGRRQACGRMTRTGLRGRSDAVNAKLRGKIGEHIDRWRWHVGLTDVFTIKSPISDWRSANRRPEDIIVPMTFLRFLAIIVLALWIGGLVTLGGIVAPTIFSVLQAQDPATGRDLAAAAFGAIFDRFQHSSWIACLVLLLSLIGRAALGPRPRRFGLRMWIAAAMLGASVASVFIVAPRIARI